MAFDPQLEELLEEAIAKIPKLARMIAHMPAEQYDEAMRIAEDSYRLTAHDLGLGEEGERWISAVMSRLRTETELRSSVSQILLKTLYKEITSAEA